jgi:5-methylcytosine-specific restriction endonuclease McrA
MVEEYNMKLSKWNPEQYPDSKTLNANILGKCKETGMYLGLFSHVSDEYRYDWVKSLIQVEKGIVIRRPKNTAPKKATIPKKIREDAWNTHVGMNKKSALCICCRTSEIDVFNFHAGHVKSEANGGVVNVDNIRPVCSSCNQSMGTQNMDEYVRTYFLHNLTKFNSITYDEPNSSKKKWNLGIFS